MASTLLPSAKVTNMLCPCETVSPCVDTSYAEMKLCVAPLSTRATAAVESCAQSELHTPSHYGDIQGYQSAIGLSSDPSVHYEHPRCTCTGKRSKRAEEAMVETPPLSMAGEADPKSKLTSLTHAPRQFVRPYIWAGLGTTENLVGGAV